jgi:SAM-dependent methyltransferase
LNSHNRNHPPLVSLIRKIVANDEVPDCLHKCTVAVKLADERHVSKLDPKSIKNAKVFAKLMRRLRKEEAVAILGKDKLGRFGILTPMGESNGQDSSYTADDFAATCYVGDVKEVMEFLTHRAGSAAPIVPVANTTSEGVMWQPPTAEEPSSSAGLWKPPGADDDDNGGDTTSFSAPWETGQTQSAAPWEVNQTNSTAAPSWAVEESGSNKRTFDDVNGGDHDDGDKNENEFHTDSGAAAADAFYSGLTRSLNTRANSRLYHMRAFNGWVKATQIQELDPRIFKNGKQQPRGPLRVLDLACGKGGDLTKWTLHERGMGNYVGIDVARGSLKDAAIRARELRKRNKLSQAIFTCADLGADVPGRKKSPSHHHLQKLLTWSIQNEPAQTNEDPEFKPVRGGGISESDRFDVVSVQFAIHYMMSSGKRARRFFHTVSQLLEIGGNLICTTIDARVVINHMIDLGLNFHFEDDDAPEFDKAVVVTGAGACKLTFEPEVVKRIFTTKADGSKGEEDLFGLQYTFTLVEGEDHGAGVGDAVNLPEWLTPIPVLKALASEAGLELDYAQNFHEFFEARKDASAHPAAHHALYNMKVMNRDGTISKDEWSISRMYAAIRFRKVRESTIQTEEEEEEEEEEAEPEPEKEAPAVELDPIKAKKMLPMAMMKAKRAAGEDEWKTLSSEEKKRLTQIELEKLAAK